MSYSPKLDREHHEINQLLPWFVNRTLDSSQRQSVSRHIESCVECREEVQLLRSLNGSVKNEAQDSYQLHADVDKSLAGVMGRISSEERKADTPMVTLPGLRHNLKKWSEVLAVFPSVRWNAVALASVLTAVIGLQLLGDSSENDYSVLSSSDSNDSTMTLTVKVFEDVGRDQAMSIIQTEFDILGQQVAITPVDNGAFSVALPSSVSVDELSGIIDELENSNQINRVEFQP